jgi:hypothetical protein
MLTALLIARADSPHGCRSNSPVVNPMRLRRRILPDAEREVKFWAGTPQGAERVAPGYTASGETTFAR